MGLNITHTMNNFQFENRENLRNTARDILNRQGSSAETTQRIINQTIFDSKSQLSNIYSPQLAILKASSQISLNTPLKETLKYLKNNANKKTVKEPVLGELWELFTSNSEEKNYNGELLDLVIDTNSDNIFIAA